MPYIKPADREKFENLVKTMHLVEIKTAGDLNYLVTQLVYSFLGQKPQSYQSYNDVMGALEGSKIEVYRRSISNYEDEKIKLNGDVP